MKNILLLHASQTHWNALVLSRSISPQNVTKANKNWIVQTMKAATTYQSIILLSSTDRYLSCTK